VNQSGQAFFPNFNGVIPMQTQIMVLDGEAFDKLRQLLGPLAKPGPAGTKPRVRQSHLKYFVRFCLGEEAHTSSQARGVHRLARALAGEGWERSPDDQEDLVHRIARELYRFLRKKR
jgi:hypothetical protein